MPSENATMWDRLCLAQAEMANPVKSKAVKAGARSYNYEVLADVLEIVTNALNAHGLALCQGVRMLDVGVYTLETGFACGDVRLILDVRPIDFPADPQAAGSKETYARRYALKTAFGLAGVDDDGEAAHRAAEMPVRAAVAPAKAPSAPAPSPSPISEAEKRTKALLRECKVRGLDVAIIGQRIEAELKKKSTAYSAADWQRAAEIVEETLANAEQIGD